MRINFIKTVILLNFTEHKKLKITLGNWFLFLFSIIDKNGRFPFQVDIFY